MKDVRRRLRGLLEKRARCSTSGGRGGQSFQTGGRLSYITLRTDEKINYKPQSADVFTKIGDYTLEDGGYSAIDTNVTPQQCILAYTVKSTLSEGLRRTNLLFTQLISP